MTIITRKELLTTGWGTDTMWSFVTSPDCRSNKRFPSCTLPWIPGVNHQKKQKILTPKLPFLLYPFSPSSSGSSFIHPFRPQSGWQSIRRLLRRDKTEGWQAARSPMPIDDSSSFHSSLTFIADHIHKDCLVERDSRSSCYQLLHSKECQGRTGISFADRKRDRQRDR